MDPFQRLVSLKTPNCIEVTGGTVISRNASATHVPGALSFYAPLWAAASFLCNVMFFHTMGVPRSVYISRSSCPQDMHRWSY